MKTDAYQQLLKEAERAGATLTLTGSGHWKITKGGPPVFAPQTPSDTRALHNLRAELRRAGILQRRSRISLAPTELEFLQRFENGRLKSSGDIPPKLQARGLIKVSNRYKHGVLVGWIAWVTPDGQKALEAHA